MIARKSKNNSVSKAVPCQVARLHVHRQAEEYALSSERRPVCPSKYLTHPMEVDETLNELGWKDFYVSLSEGFLPHDDE